MSERDESMAPEQGTGETKPGVRLARNMTLYTVMRLLVVVVIALLIIGIGRLVGVDVPVLVAAIGAVVLALPISMIVFTRLRAEINSDIAAVDAGRREKREDLHRRMDEA